MVLVNLIKSDPAVRRAAKYARHSGSEKRKASQLAWYYAHHDEARARQRAQKKRYHAADPQKKRERNKAWRESLTDEQKHAMGLARRERESLDRDRVRLKKREQARRRREANPQKALDQRLRANYGITLVEYNEIVLQQNGCCAICRSLLVGGRKQHLDHDHLTGVVRGVLCSECNTAIGKLHDSIENLERAIEYLRRAGGGR